jgi:hypothetical protein
MRLIWMCLLSIAASIFLELADPVHRRFDFMIAGIAGRAFAIYVVSGIIPLMIWAAQHIGRNTVPPAERRFLFLYWGIIMGAFVFCAFVGVRYEATHHPHV